MQRRSSRSSPRGRWCFNPHPALSPDATRIIAQASYDNAVSILIRPSRRMQPANWWNPCTRTGFNPHPALSPDATGLLNSYRCCPTGFNPHPALSPDATPYLWRWVPRYGCFNPHPALSPDATGDSRAPDHLAPSFNPHPALSPDATHNLIIPGSGSWFQSSSGPLAGCNRRPKPFAPCLKVSILIRPSRRMQPRIPGSP